MLPVLLFLIRFISLVLFDQYEPKKRARVRALLILAGWCAAIIIIFHKDF